MVAEGDIVCHHQSIQVLDVQYRCISSNNSKPSNQKIEEIVEVSTPSSSSSVYRQIRASVSIPTEISRPEVVRKTSGLNSDGSLGSPVIQFMPTIRSGSFSDIGPRRFMEDEHIMIDDLSSCFDSVFQFPTPSAFYGVFDGHGGAEAAAYMKENAVRFFFENAATPQTYVSDDDDNLVDVVNSFRKAFLLADNALADDCNVSSSSGTTAITALLLGRRLLVANAGDCRAVLCRKGKAIDMSQDHKPIHPPERRRIEQLGGYVDDGYLNGVLSVTRALGDWDMKFPRGSPSPLIAEPEFGQAILTKDDEFLIIGCDGLWDVMTSQEAVSFVRRCLRRHNDPQQCARDLIKEALRLNTGDNLTVIVICFLDSREMFPSPPRQRKGRWCFSTEALFTLRRHMDVDESN